MRHRTALYSFTLLGFTAYAAGLPVINTPAIGDKEITGTFPVYQGCTPVLTLLVDKEDGRPLRIYVEPDRGEFRMELAATIADKQKLLVKHRCGQNPASDSDELEIKLPEGKPAPQIVSIASVYGSNKLRVFYAPLKGVESATLKVSTCIETRDYKLSDDDLKRTDVEVTLTRGLFCNRDASDVTADNATNKAALSLTYKGKKSPDPSVMVIPIGEPLLEINGPIREGTTKVTGKADAVLSKVVLMVYSGWRANTQSSGNGKTGNPGNAEVAELKRRIESLEAAEPKQSARIRQTSKRVASPAPDSPAKAGDEVLRCEESELEESKEVPVADGAFSVILGRSLMAGACIQARPVFAIAPPVERERPVAYYSEPKLVRSVLEDWARMRGYFSLGSTIDHYNDQFNRQDYFVGWTSDALVWGKMVDKECRASKGQAAQTCSDAQLRTSFLRRFRKQLNLFTEARVRMALATGTATSSGTTPNPPAPSTRLLPPDHKAAQSGFFQIGVHTPFSWKGMDWVNRGQQFSFYVSPIAKIGGETLDRDLVTYQLKQNFSAANTNGTIHREEVRRGVLPFYGYGMRMGLFQYEFFGGQKEAKNRQVTNDPIGYIDFTWGKAHAFRSYDFAYTRLVPKDPTRPNSDLQEVTYLPGNQQLIEPAGLVRTEMSSSVKRRFGIEGRIKLFSLPALIGVDYNVRTNARDWEPNQLRFVLAFRIDAQRALGRVFKNRFESEGE